MINTQVSIHDKFSVEFKIGFITSNKSQDINEFKINTWIFTPNSLDVNPETYTKQQFYSDIKSNIRLITPIYTLAEISNGEGPFPRLSTSIEKLLENPDESNEESYIYQTKMLLCILKSALRENSIKICAQKDQGQKIDLINQFVKEVQHITAYYRSIRDQLLVNEVLSDSQKEYFLFGDEFLGNIIQFSAYRIMDQSKGLPYFQQEIKPLLLHLIEQENENRRMMNYSIPLEGDEQLNSLILIKKNVLKKFVESDLYLQTEKKKDGAFARELYYSLGAGVAMIFATVISFFATQRFGNFTSSLFFVLVLSYMLKDRIKEASRFYFSSKLDRKYFDHKWKLSLRRNEIGWIKEGFDFIPENKVPEDIMNLRNKTFLVEAENKVYSEKIILFRKRVCLSKSDIEEYKEYHLSGVNDIIRFNLLSFVKKMDNPEVPIYLPDEEAGFKTILGNRVYAVYFILKCESDNDTYYKKYRLLFNRNGISSVDEIN